MTDSVDVVIVGAGAAGLSAALTLGRARREVVVVDGGEPRNGVAAHSHGVLTRDGTPPLEFLRLAREEVERYGVRIVPARAVAARAADGFEVELDDGGTLRSRQLLIATGLVDELPDTPGVAELWGSGTVVCPYCDGWEVRDQPIAVLGTGHGSVHHAHMARQWSPEVTLLTDDGAMTIDDFEAEEFRLRGILVESAAVERIDGDGDSVEVSFRDGRRQPFRKLFVLPRYRQQDGLLRSLGAEVEQAKVGERVKTGTTGGTTVLGLWAAGNVVDPGALVPVAMGAGAAAAVAINAHLVGRDLERAVADAHR